MSDSASYSEPSNMDDDIDWETYVFTEAFDQDCALVAMKARERAAAEQESDSDNEDFIWSSSNDGTSLAAPGEPDSHEVSKIEAHLYYAGIGGKGRGPKLIYRTSKDEFVEPEGPGAYRRLMRVADVPWDHKMGKDGLWDRIRDRTVELLDQRGIKLTSVDLVRFTWLKKSPKGEIKDDNDNAKGDEDEGDLDCDQSPTIKPGKGGIRYYTNPTIWIGVLPDTLTGAVAHESAKDILAVLQEHNMADVDIAYRESL
ncbi:hypothetical protein FRB90_000594 [Tulasnella sp. 427]|nr:hypothetical protein FRB90_000594 [Tulasnella sp. 427]